VIYFICTVEGPLILISGDLGSLGQPTMLKRIQAGSRRPRNGLAQH
jgi:hypothetical protein